MSLKAMGYAFFGYSIDMELDIQFEGSTRATLHVDVSVALYNQVFAN